MSGWTDLLFTESVVFWFSMWTAFAWGVLYLSVTINLFHQFIANKILVSSRAYPWSSKKPIILTKYKSVSFS